MGTQSMIWGRENDDEYREDILQEEVIMRLMGAEAEPTANAADSRRQSLFGLGEWEFEKRRDWSKEKKNRKTESQSESN